MSMKPGRMGEAWRGWVQVRMWNAESLSREQIREFFKSSQGIEFAGCGRNEEYPWVEGVLKAQDYGKLSKGERGVVRAYVEKVTIPGMPTNWRSWCISSRGCCIRFSTGARRCKRI